MTKRYDVSADTARKKDNGYYWSVKIGAAFPRDDGSIDVVLDALPITTLDKNGNPQIRLKLWPAKEGERAPSSPAGLDDDVPF